MGSICQTANQFIVTIFWMISRKIVRLVGIGTGDVRVPSLPARQERRPLNLPLYPPLLAASPEDQGQPGGAVQGHRPGNLNAAGATPRAARRSAADYPVTK